MAGGYRCSRCGSDRYYLYDARFYSNSGSSGSGNWIFVPHDDQSMKRRPDDPGDGESFGERAESEARTDDVMVDPDTMIPLSRRKGRAARQAQKTQAQLDLHDGELTTSPKTLLNPLPPTAPTMTSGLDKKASTSSLSSHNNGWRDSMLKGLTDAVIKKDDNDKNRNIQKGQVLLRSIEGHTT